MELLDQSAVFDTTDHSALLSCLESWFGISGTVLRRFNSYLIHCFQCLKIGSTFSEIRQLLCRVPQGLVMGPILLSLDMTPLSKAVGRHPFIKFLFYADDTQLFIHLTHKNVTQSLEGQNRCLDDVKNVYQQIS